MNRGIDYRSRWLNEETLRERSEKNDIEVHAPGERLKLRDDALGHIQPRQWIKRVENDDTVLVMDESGGFGWSVKIDHIDWEAYEKQSSKSLSAA